MPSPSPSVLPATAELPQVNPSIWKACAGSIIQIPPANSRVYYFPQGHIEHSSQQVQLSRLDLSKPAILCRIRGVRYLINPVTDEVLAKIALEPISNGLEWCKKDDVIKVEEGEGVKVVSFSKVLTTSDANNGGGFSVPRLCADTVYPPLDYYADPPVQTLIATDMHGIDWRFRHIYRGTPRRHLLTTGWSKFVNSKKLIAGDSVVFMRDETSGKIFVGVRRGLKPTADYCSRWICELGHMDDDVDEFWRSGKAWVSAESVMDAAERAARGLPFEIVYYPRMGSPDFVVKAEMVEGAFNESWTTGMRVKMATMSEDSMKMAWFQGAVSAFLNNEPWGLSPWRALKVTWDDPQIMQNAERVSPWQVEPLAPPGTPMKKLKVFDSGLLIDGGGKNFPMTGLTDTMMGNSSPSLQSVESFPAGMQGARHDLFSVSNKSSVKDSGSLTDGGGKKFPMTGLTDTMMGNSIPSLQSVESFPAGMQGARHDLFSVSNKSSVKDATRTTDLTIGSSQSDVSSLDSQSTVHSLGTELVENQPSKLSPKVGSRSIKLFGEVYEVGGNDRLDLSLNSSSKKL